MLVLYSSLSAGCCGCLLRIEHFPLQQQPKTCGFPVSQTGRKELHGLSDIHTVGGWQPETVPNNMDDRVSARMTMVRNMPASCTRVKPPSLFSAAHHHILHGTFP